MWVQIRDILSTDQGMGADKGPGIDLRYTYKEKELQNQTWPVVKQVQQNLDLEIISNMNLSLQYLHFKEKNAFLLRAFAAEFWLLFCTALFCCYSRHKITII